MAKVSCVKRKLDVFSEKLGPTIDLGGGTDKENQPQFGSAFLVRTTGPPPRLAL